MLMGGGRGWWDEAQLPTHAAEVDCTKSEAIGHSHTCTCR